MRASHPVTRRGRHLQQRGGGVGGLVERLVQAERHEPAEEDGVPPPL